MISIDEINSLKEENTKLNAIIDSYQPKIQALKDEKDKYYQQTLDDEIQINELYEENERLKEEVETRDNLVEHFRKEAINWAKISNDCIKDIENYKHTLQEIKEIAERQMRCCTCNFQKDDYKSGCKTCESKYAREMAVEIIQIITKAEEE